MIIKFKIFESEKTRVPEFKVGDFVYADNTMNTMFLDKDVRYEINRVIMDDSFNGIVYKYELVEFPDEFFYEYRFIPELEYHANKYNI